MDIRNALCGRLNLALLALMATTLSACGFQQDVRFSGPSSGQDRANGPSGPAVEPSAGAFEAFRKVDKPSSAAGWVRESAFAAADAAADAKSGIDETYEAKVSIPYGWVYRAASFAVKAAAPMACQFGGVEAEGNPYSAYASGEIPCGKIVGGGYKQVATLTLPAYDQKSGPLTAHADGFSTAILLGRKQNSGLYKESRLDSKREETLASSPNFGDDVSVRWEPKADGLSARLHLCAAVPGTDATVTPFTVKAKASVKTIFKTTISSKFDVTPGQASWNYARGCFATDVAFASGSLVPTLNFDVEQDPYVDGARYSGLNIKIENWFLRLIDDIMGWFRASLRKSAIKMVVRKANALADSELQTGRWFARVHGEEVVHQISVPLNKSIVKAAGRTGLPTTAADLRKILSRQCRLLPTLKRLEMSVADLCQQALDSVSVGFQPFYRDPAQAAAGCYDHYANIHQTAGKWWSSKCGYSMRLQVRVRVELTPDQKNALDQAVASIEKLDDLVRAAEDRLGSGHADAAILAFALDEAAKNKEVIASVDDLLSVAARYRNRVLPELQDWVRP